MIKTVLSSIFLLLCTFFLAPFSPAKAQTTLEAQTIEVVQVCLNTVYCRKDQSCSIQHSHRVRISSNEQQKPPENNPETYITECVMYDPPYDRANDPQGPRYVCTTGNPELDMKLFCESSNAATCNADVRSTEETPPIPRYNHLAQLQKDIAYSIKHKDDYGAYYYNGVNFEKKDPPQYVTTNTAGRIPVMEWQSYTPEQHERSYSAWSKRPIATVPAGTIGGQQQATLAFRYKLSECATVQFDPYGRVFDAVSLDPIPGALPGGQTLNMELLSRVGNTDQYTKLVDAKVPNPYLLGPDGFFSFYVPNGYYKLNPIGTAIGTVYEFRDKPAPSGPNATEDTFNKVYSDIYYANSEPILQEGAIVHRDVPLYPKDGVGKTYDVKVLSQFVEARENGDLYFHGKVSHPYAVLKVYPCADKSRAECTNPLVFTSTSTTNPGGPDANGKFAVVIEQSELINGEVFQIVFERQDLRAVRISSNSFVEKVTAFLRKLIPDISVNAQERSTGYTINPVPLYLEGFAYDATGTLLPNATVGVYITQTDTPVYQTKANSNGFFRITSEYLPRFPYSLRFTSADNKKVDMTTAQFLQQNADFIETENVKIYVAAPSSNNPRQNITPSYVPRQGVALKVTPANQKTSPAVSGTPAATTTTRSPVLLVGVILLLLLGAAGIMLGIYIYKKNAAPPEAY